MAKSLGENKTRLEQQLQREAASFLQALNSYPECFAQNPMVTFQQHFASIASQPEPESKQGHQG